MNEMYLEDSYLWAFDATVDDVFEGKVILDKTAFYPQSGGQPSDAGILLRGGELRRSIHTGRFGRRLLPFARRNQVASFFGDRLDDPEEQGGERSHAGSRIPSLVEIQDAFSRGSIVCWNQEDLNADPARVGSAGSRTWVEALTPLAQQKSCVFIEGDSRQQARVLFERLKEKNVLS
jgi:hypothetical protein